MSGDQIRREWTGAEVDPDEAFCTDCGWVSPATDAADAIRKANLHECPGED